jgi:hypothetical protein
MPLRMLEKEKEGHRKVKTDFRKKEGSDFKRDKSAPWRMKKEKPKSWITKKEKPKSWITKKKPTKWITKKPTTKSTLTGTDTTRGGGPDSGNVGYNKDFIYRAGKHRKKWREEMEKRKKKPVGKAKGGRAGFQGGGRTNLLEELGRVEGEPSNRNRRAEISRVHGELNRGYKGGGRTKKSIGGVLKLIKKVIKPKPPGVFKPKPVPKEVTDVDKPFKGYDKSYTKADEKKIDKLLFKLGDEIKAQPLPPQLKKTLKKLQKAYPHKKAAGGRIGLRHGGSAGAATRGHGAEIK